MAGRLARLLGVLVLGATVLLGCNAGKPVVLDGVEIKEYQGANLTSLTTLPDNSIRGPQQIARDGVRLEVSGLVDRPLALSYDQVVQRQQYKKVVTLNCVEGWSATMLWEGVLLDDLFTAAGARTVANTVIFHALDGYTSSLPLAFVREHKILLAHRLNEVTLPAERGFPFVVVAEDKWGYKWVKWVDKVELSADEGYRGYWESRGYSGKGDLSGSFLGVD